MYNKLGFCQIKMQKFDEPNQKKEQPLTSKNHPQQSFSRVMNRKSSKEAKNRKKTKKLKSKDSKSPKASKSPNISKLRSFINQVPQQLFNKQTKGHQLPIPRDEIVNISFNQAVETERQIKISQNSGERKNRYQLGDGLKPKSRPLKKRGASNISDATKSDLGETEQKSISSQDQQSYDGDSGRDQHIPYDLLHNNRFNEQQQNFMKIHERLAQDQQADPKTGSPYYERQCRHHEVVDPNDLQCTFKPHLYKPLGAPKDENMQVDPLMFSPIKTIKHSPMTKSSINYHYKRLAHARQGPQVYRKKPELTGGGAFYQKIAVEGTELDPIPASRVAARKKYFQHQAKQHYFDGIKGNDPRFNLAGGVFKGALTLKPNMQTLDLPDTGLDRKRLKQKDLLGNSFDAKFGTHENSRDILSKSDFRSNTLDQRKILQSVNSARGIQNGVMLANQVNIRRDGEINLRRSIQTRSKLSPFVTQGVQSLYSKATIAERFTNKGIRQRTTQAKTQDFTIQTSDRPSKKSLLRSNLNTKSQISDAFELGLIKEGSQTSKAGGQELIRGVPKFVNTASQGLRLATEQELQMIQNQQVQGIQDSATYRNFQYLQNLETQALNEDQRKNYEQSRQSPKKITINRFQEEWYPEGIDPDRQNFLKRSLRNYHFNPNRTFTQIAHLSPTSEQLIPQLFTQSNDFNFRNRHKKVASELHNIVKECTFQVASTYDTEQVGSNAYIEIHYKLISKQKKNLTVDKKKKSLKKEGSSDDSGELAFKNAGDRENVGIIKPGQDKINLPSGFYNLTNLPLLNKDYFAKVYNKYKKSNNDAAGETQSPAGELASEQMAQLASEMLDSDQRLDQGDDETYSLNNLIAMTFADFLILHRIFPKMFALEMDSHFTETSAVTTQGIQKKHTFVDQNHVLVRHESINIQKALTRRRSNFKRQNTKQDVVIQNTPIKLENQRDAKALQKDAFMSNIRHQKMQSVDVPRLFTLKGASQEDTILEQSSSLASEDLHTTTKQNSEINEAKDVIQKVHQSPLVDKIKYGSSFEVPMLSSKLASVDVSNMTKKINKEAFFFQVQDRKNVVNIKTNKVNLKTTSIQSPISQGSKDSENRTFLTKKTSKSTDILKLTSYEVCLQKYIIYLKARKLERCEALIKQGKKIFQREECYQQFTFNQGLILISQKNYDGAIEKYLELYKEVAEKFTVRPAAQRMAGNNPEEVVRFAIIHNLIIAYMLKEMESPDRVSQQDLYQLLRDEKLLHVRFTYSPDELILYKMATYVKQFIKNEQAKRYISGVYSNNSPAEPQSDPIPLDKQVHNQSDQLSYNEEYMNEQIQSELHDLSSTNIKKEDIIPSGQMQDDLNEGDINQGKDTNIKYGPQFKKIERKRAVKDLLHPLYNHKKKLQFLNEHTQILRIPPLPRDEESKAFSNPDELLMQKIKAQNKQKEKQKQEVLKQRVSKVLDSVAKKKRDQTKNKELGLRLQGGESKNQDSPIRGVVPFSETADSIFDEKGNVVNRIASNQGSQDDPEDINGAINDEIMENSVEDEAHQLGVDLSALYSHQKPKAVLFAQKRLVMDVLKKQTINKNREQKYRNMDINRIEYQKKMSKQEAAFNQKMENLEDTILSLDKIGAAIIGDGGRQHNELSPMQVQYKGLAISIRNLCQEPNIADTILDYLKKRTLNIKWEKWGSRDGNIKSIETNYSPALEVIIHATRHILNKEKVNFNDGSSRVDLINRIIQVKEIFEQTLSKFELLTKRDKGNLQI